MKKERRRFSKEEYIERQLKVRNSMIDSNIDALIAVSYTHLTLPTIYSV